MKHRDAETPRKCREDANLISYFLSLRLCVSAFILDFKGKEHP
jgi:hypothetical protein